MIVSHEWLKQFVPHGRSAAEIGELLSRHTVTLDSLETTGAELAPFVVAQVVEAKRHPNSERLWVTKVDDGSGALLDVVCGAPNVVAGHKYPFARTGTRMPGGLVIEQRKIRGETSNGMLCSARELGLGEDHDGILTLDTDATTGTPLLDVLPASDARLDLDVLPNRPDLLSHRGIAREVGAILGVPVHGTPLELQRAEFAAPPGYTHGDDEAIMDGVTVRIEDRASCPAYVACIIRGVSVTPSPEWLSRRLASVGLRSISNIVDATNYVLHAFGQPVHAFDLAKLAGRTIAVRPTRTGETVVTLDGVTRTIAAGTTVIADAERPVALAGVMGGRDSEVTDSTTEVLLEVAAFDPKFVRSVRRAVGLNTDASYRFERGVDITALREVAAACATLITSVAGGALEGVIDLGDTAVNRPQVVVRPARVRKLLGAHVSTTDIAQRLQSIGCATEREGGLTNELLRVTPPAWRHDLLVEVDFIEEVARLGGFDALPDDLRAFRPGRVPDDPMHGATQRLRALLVGSGLLEARPMPFTRTGDERTPRVLNPLADDEPFLRSTLLDTLARRVEYNLAQSQGDLRLFEIGDVFASAGGRLPREETRAAAILMGRRRPPHFTEPRPPAFDAWDAKALAESMVRSAYPGRSYTVEPALEPLLWSIDVAGAGLVGTIARVALDKPVWAEEAFGIELSLGVVMSDDVADRGAHHAEVAEGLDRDDGGPTGAHWRVAALPTMPAANFDLALVVPDTLRASDVERVLRATGGPMLERVELFDEFRGRGVPASHRSLAWRLTLRHPERTLREKEIEGRRAALLAALARELGVTPRAL